MSDQDKSAEHVFKELVSRLGQTPTYELVHVDMESRGKLVYYCTLSIGPNRGLGSGTSKKKAKHEAARDLLRIVKSEQPPQKKRNLHGDNAIARLKETCEINCWAAPIYEIKSEGPAHESLFISKCTVMDYVETGEGRLSKLAKQAAAQKILDLMTNGAELEKANRFLSTISDLQDLAVDTIPALQVDTEEEEEDHHQKLIGPAMQELQRTSVYAIDDKVTLKGLLERIAKEQSFQLNECQMDQLSITGNFIFLLEMTTRPISMIFTGRGRTRDQAEVDAITTSLQYWKRRLE